MVATGAVVVTGEEAVMGAMEEEVMGEGAMEGMEAAMAAVGTTAEAGMGAGMLRMQLRRRRRPDATVASDHRSDGVSRDTGAWCDRGHRDL